MKKGIFIMAALFANIALSDNVQNTAVSSGRDDVVYLAPAIEPYEALPLGNGRLGVMLGNRIGMDYSFFPGDFFASADETQMLISSGSFSLQLPEDWIKGFIEERVVLYDGAIVTSFKTDKGNHKISSWLMEDLDLLVIEIESESTLPDLNAVMFASKRPDGIAPVISTENDAPSLTTVGLSKRRAVSLIMQPLEPENAVKADSDGKQINIRIPSNGRKSMCLLVANGSVVNTDIILAEDALKNSLWLISKARAMGLEKAREKRNSYWHGFWNRSSVLLHSSDGLADYVENIYNLHLYWMASMSRGQEAPKFNGGNFLFKDDLRSWGGSYWYQNTREMYWPLLAADHPELWKPFIDLYWRNLPAANELARNSYDCDGACFEETMDRKAKGDKGSHFYTNLYLTTGTEMAHQMYSYYLYTEDKAFLSEKAYPLLKETVTYHLNFLTKEADGTYHVYPSNARETYWWIKDSITDLTALRATLPILIEASRILSLDKDKREEWIKILANLAAFPVDNETGTYAPGVFLDEFPATRFKVSEKIYPPGIKANDKFPEKRTTKSNKKNFNFENVACEPIYPWGLIGTDSPPDELARMHKTFQVRPFRGWGFGNAWDPSAIWAVRLGLINDAQRLVYNFANNIQMFPNGMSGTPGARPVEWGKTIGDSPGFDASGVMATLVQEMLLFSGNGKIRVFPALPKGWRGEFTLAAQGGFMISSSVNDNGKVVEVSALSRRGGKCIIVNPWKTGAILKQEKGEEQKFTGDISFQAVPGKKYLITPCETVAKSAELDVVKNTGPKWSVHISDSDTAEAYIDRLPKQGERPPMFGFIGITADGRNPTRRNVTEALKVGK